MWDDECATHTEATEDLEERLEGLGVRLGQLTSQAGEDSRKAGIKFVMQVEQLIPDYVEAYGGWLEEDPSRAASVSEQQYAYETLTQLDPMPFES